MAGTMVADTEAGLLLQRDSGEAMKQALFQTAEGEHNLRCGLCSHRCLIPPGHRGICAVRENRAGVLYSLVYDRIVSENVDPIEKKPLFHFLPGSMSYSIATPGCNFRCKHCQNADISQLPRDRSFVIGQPIKPEEIVAAALESGCRSISYTYTEPTIFFELAYETAVLANEKGLKNVFVTNGYITPEALRMISPVLQGANIDLKAFTDAFYREICGARLQPVLDSIKLYHELGIWIEITTLIIPGHNDGEQELTHLARFIRSVDENIPWHVTRFHPTYRLTDQPITPIASLRRARDIGFSEGLRFVYEGNIPGEGEGTACPNCGKTVIKRLGFSITENNIQTGTCGFCKTALPGIWN